MSDVAFVSICPVGPAGQMLAALVLQPAVIGLGIDENTAIIVTGDEFEVVVAGTITVVDETTATHNNLDGWLKDEPIALCGVKPHILPTATVLTSRPLPPTCK